MINPRAKREKDLGRSFALPRPIYVFTSDEVAQKALGALEIFLDGQIPPFVFVEEESKAFLKLIHTSAQEEKAESYRLEAEEKGITASFSTFMGGRNAMASLYQLLTKVGEELFVRCARLEDWSDTLHRELMLDMSFRGMPPERVKRIMVDMALSKLNVLHMHLMDGRTLSLQFDAYPAANNRSFEYYTKEEMKDIVAFGKSVGIECLPEIEFATHNTNLSRSMPELRCETSSLYAEQVYHVTCITKEEVYKFYDALIGEITEIFDFPIIHIGSDEIVAYDAGIWPMWYDCKHCRKKAEELGIRMDTQKELDERMADGTLIHRGLDGLMEMMMYGVKRMHEIVSKHGRRMMMWNDNIDVSKPVDLPKDILIHFWRIAAPYRGPREGCTMEKFLEQGFEIINSHYPQTYLEEDIYKPEIPLDQWAPRVYPPSAEAYKSQIRGGGACAWGAGNMTHYKVNLPTMIGFYGDRLWDQSPGEYGEDFERKLTKLILGLETPEGMNLFASLGGYSLPRNSWVRVRKDGPYRYANVEKITADKEEMQRTRACLESLAKGNTLYAKHAEDYLFCVNWAIDQRPWESKSEQLN